MITNRPITLLSTLSQVFPTSDEIFIACAYVSPVACEKLSLSKIGDQKTVSIIIGRAIDDGLTPAAIYYFTQLSKLLSKNGGGVRLGEAPFHSKLYVCKTGENRRFWVGSSNCTENGLNSWHEANIEVMDNPTIIEATSLCEDLFSNGRQVKSAKVIKLRKIVKSGDALSFSTSPDFPSEVPDTFELSLLDRNNLVSEKSGLNWWNSGGRPRSPNEAYIPIKKSALAVIRSVLGEVNRGDVIDAITHDGTMFKMKFEGSAAAESSDPKQLSTAGDKTILGKWILRKVLKLDQGVLVTREILDKYGRTSLTFSKLLKSDGKPILFIDFSH